MRYQKIIGFVALLIGIVLLGYGVYGSYRMLDEKHNIESKTRYVPGETVRSTIRSELYAQVNQYTTSVTLCYVGGAVFFIGGIVLLRYWGKKK
jgi:TRAP-type C4-dicarboxylate transport system permease small subunit